MKNCHHFSIRVNKKTWEIHLKWSEFEKSVNHSAFSVLNWKASQTIYSKQRLVNNLPFKKSSKIPVKARGEHFFYSYNKKTQSINFIHFYDFFNYDNWKRLLILWLELNIKEKLKCRLVWIIKLNEWFEIVAVYDVEPSKKLKCKWP